MIGTQRTKIPSKYRKLKSYIGCLIMSAGWIAFIVWFFSALLLGSIQILRMIL